MRLWGPCFTIACCQVNCWSCSLVSQKAAPSKCILLSTSEAVRKDTKNSVLSQESDKWSVKFDVLDLGCHLDATFRGWSATLATRVMLVIARLVLIFALLLDFHGCVWVVRSMYLPAALHGIEASFLASDSLRKLRSSIQRVVWSRRHLLVSVGAVISVIDGPTGCDLASCVVWFRDRLLRRSGSVALLRFVVLIVFLRWLVR